MIFLKLQVYLVEQPGPFDFSNLLAEGMTYSPGLPQRTQEKVYLFVMKTFFVSETKIYIRLVVSICRFLHIRLRFMEPVEK